MPITKKRPFAPAVAKSTFTVVPLATAAAAAVGNEAEVGVILIE